MRKSKCIKNGHKRKVYSFYLLLFYNHSNLTIILDVYKNFHTYSDSDNGKKRVCALSALRFYIPGHKPSWISQVLR